MHKFPIWSLARARPSPALKNFSCLAPFCHIALSIYADHSYFSRRNVTVAYCNSFTCMIIVLVCLFALRHIYASFATIRKSINFNCDSIGESAATCATLLIKCFQEA